MGKKSPLWNSELTFSPKISATSRKLAAVRNRRVNRVKLTSVPDYFLDTAQVEPFQSRYKRLEQIPIPRKTRNRSAEVGFKVQANEVEGMHTNPHSRTSTDNLELGNVRTQPQVCATSTRIVAKLGSDFMSRQQHLLDKKLKIMETCFQFRFRSIDQDGKPFAMPSPRNSLETKEEAIAWGTPGPKTPETMDIEKDKSPATLEQDPLMSMKSSPSLAVADDSVGMEHSNKSSSSIHLQRLLEGPYPHSNSNMLLRRQQTVLNTRGHKRHQTVPDSLATSRTSLKVKEPLEEEATPDHIGHVRSKTLPPQSVNKHKGLRKLGTINLERLKNAKELAEKAIKYRKIFTIHGPYAQVRECLRQRGWVEKFYRLPSTAKVQGKKKKRHSASDDDDDDDDDDDGDDDDDVAQEQENKIPPWEEEDGIYGIMSRIARNSNPTFIWSLRRDTLDFRYLQKDQIVNHYCRAGSFTTKVGLCINMRNVPWYENANPDQFFPRCYRLSHEDEKMTFIDDFRLTACMNVLKWVRLKQEGGPEPEEQMDEVCTQPECTRSRPGTTSPNKCTHMEEKRSESASIDTISENAVTSPGRKGKKKKGQPLPARTLEIAIQQIEKFIDEKSDVFLDTFIEPNSLTEEEWSQFLQWYYALVHDEAVIPGWSEKVEEVNMLLNRLKPLVPQIDLDGIKNVWIVKPGAKSRGRGIFCCDRLEDMTKLVSSSVVRKDSKFVVQKYIERPLLIYNTKFDIRQWFLVTDWNPLTFWFYKECYLRFCTQQFTLDNFDESIHLSNNAIQKNYDNQKDRPSELPVENMWSSDDFRDYLRSKGHPTLWEDVIYPGMKRAIQCALAATQDIIEFRKNSFELYGADFMLTEDYQPWLIEINSSPSMCASTKVTARLCGGVLEDTLKVVLDRRVDRNADTGLFELACKQPQVTVPPYIGIDLTITGSALHKPMDARRKSILARSSEVRNSEKDAAASTKGSETLTKTNAVSKNDTAVFKMTKAKKEIQDISRSMNENGNSSESHRKKSETQATPSVPASTPVPAPAPPINTEKGMKVAHKKLARKSMDHHPKGKTTQIVLTNPWVSNSCSKCGCGLSLRLSTEMYNCQCRKDGIRYDMGEERQRPKTPSMITAHVRPHGFTVGSSSGQSVNQFARSRVIQALVNSREFDKRTLTRTSDSLSHHFSNGAFSNHHLPRLSKRFTSNKKNPRVNAPKMFVVSNSYVS